jgi:hypothetical protein
MLYTADRTSRRPLAALSARWQEGPAHEFLHYFAGGKKIERRRNNGQALD